MTAPSCPICSFSPSEIGRAGNRDAYKVRCPRCGTFIVTDQAIDALKLPENKDRRYLVSIAMRRASQGNEIPELLSYTLEQIWGETSPHRSPWDAIDSLLLHVHDRTEDFAGTVRVSIDDYPLFGLRSVEQLRAVIGHLSTLGYVVVGADGADAFLLQLTLRGWERIPALQKLGKASNQAFVAMWFAKELDEAWHDGIRPAFDDTGWIPVRVDVVQHNDRIDDKIVAEIRRSGLLIADVTGHRPGVYFEAGLAMGLGLPVIWMVRADHLDGVHFDTRQYNHIVWETPVDLREKLNNRILATLPR